jgi:hypothetical protein
MFSRIRDRLAKLEARVTPHERRVFVCMDEDVGAFKSTNAVAPHDILVHVIFTEDGTGGNREPGDRYARV